MGTLLAVVSLDCFQPLLYSNFLRELKIMLGEDLKGVVQPFGKCAYSLSC